MSAAPSASAARRPLLALVPHLRAQRIAVAWTFVAGLANAMAQVALLAGCSYAVAVAVVEHRFVGGAWVALTVGLLLGRALLTWHEMDVSHVTAYKVLVALRLALFDGFARGVPSRRRGLHTGRLAATAMGDVEKLEFFYAHTTTQVAVSLVLLVQGAVTTAVLVPAAAWIVPAAAVLVALPTVAATRAARRHGETAAREREDLSERVVDALSGTREVIGYGLGDRVADDLVRATRRIERAEAGVARLLAGAAGLRDLVMVAAVATSVWVVVVVGAGGRVEAVLVPPLVAVVAGVLGPFADTMATLTQVQPLRASAARVVEGIHLGTHVGSHVGIHLGTVSPAGHGTTAAPAGPLGLTVSGVTFAYEGRRALDDVSLDVCPGEHLAVTGPSGAGKSTLAKLLVRLHEPDAGTIAVRGGADVTVPVRDLADLPRVVTLVEQDAPLFHGTVRDLMRLADPQVTDARIVEALAEAGLPVDDPRWEAGADTMVGERGTTLSGGERARLALARARITGARILVLDEPTASLDSETEDAVMRTIAARPAGLTVVTISHRASTLRWADRVVTIGR